MEFEGIILVLFASTVGIVAKIVWDWLQQRRQPAPVAPERCSEDTTCSTVTKMHEQQIRMDERNKYILQQMKDGKDSFNAIRGDITEIKGNVKAIAAIIDERAKAGGPLLQGDVR